MRYYVVEPEVAGGFGENTIMDPTSRPPRVTRFHFKFDGWLGDELLETVANFIVSKAVVDILQHVKATGVDFDEVEISKSALFEELYPHRQLPEFEWIKVTGRAGMDDFAISKAHRLVVSEKVLTALQSKLQHCTVSDYANS